MIHPTTVITAVKAHLATAPGRYANLLEAEDLGPEPVRLLDVANVDHQVIEARRGQRLRRRRRNDPRCPVSHDHAPQCWVMVSTVNYRTAIRNALPASPVVRFRRRTSGEGVRKVADACVPAYRGITSRVSIFW